MIVTNSCVFTMLHVSKTPLPSPQRPNLQMHLWHYGIAYVLTNATMGNEDLCFSIS